MVSSSQPLGVDIPAVTHFDGRVPPPRFATLHTTRYCNLRCTMCLFVANGTVVTGPHMDPVLVDKFTDEVLPEKYRRY